MRGVLRQDGYTLAELLVSIAIVSTVVAAAVPEMANMLASMRLRSGMSALCDGLRLTRDEAIRRNGRVAMCKSADGRRCTKQGDWSQGWIIFHDPNNNADVDPGESVLYSEPPMTGTIHVSGNTPVSNYVSYTSFGKAKLLSDAFQAGHFTVCAHSATSTEAYLVYIGILGQPRVEKSQVGQCG